MPRASRSSARRSSAVSLRVVIVSHAKGGGYRRIRQAVDSVGSVNLMKRRVRVVKQVWLTKGGVLDDGGKARVQHPSVTPEEWGRR